jgi:NAD(P)-dependent dehydrogenase (short-subunit alcohol dehydrogenase family)
MRGLGDKTILLAGSATGIGAEAARRLADEGARVVLGDINAEGAEQVAAEIRNGGGDAHAVAFDISDDQSCAALVAAAIERYEGIDGLFNVAAELSPRNFDRDTDLLEIPLEVWQRTLDVNLTGYLLMTRHALPHLLRRGGGSIVNTISNLVLNGDPSRPAYGASKGGIVALTRHVASRWGREGIRCNAVAPGMTLTENVERAISPEERRRIETMLRSKRFGHPRDIAAMAAFLLSDDGEWVNGQIYAVNGGTGLR